MAEHLVGRESDAVPDGRLYCGRGLDEFSPQGIGNLAWSYAKQAQLAVETINRVEGLTSDTSGRLFIFSTICIDVGETLIKRLFNACAEADIVNHGTNDGIAYPLSTTRLDSPLPFLIQTALRNSSRKI